MNYLKISLFFIAGFMAFDCNAQSKTDNALQKDSFIIKIDSLEIDVFNNYESSIPPINLNNLREPTLFILDDKALKISKFSELAIDNKNIQLVTIIQDPMEIKELGHSKFNSIVKIRTEEEKD